MPPCQAGAVSYRFIASATPLVASPTRTASQRHDPATAPPHPTGDRRPAASASTTFTLVSWNTEWSTDGRAPESSLSPHLEDPTGADAHLAKVAAQLAKWKDTVDAFALQEVEDCATLNRLLPLLKDDAFRAFLVPGTDTATRQNVALVTKVDPIADLARTDARQSFPDADSTCGGNVSRGTSGISKHAVAR